MSPHAFLLGRKSWSYLPVGLEGRCEVPLGTETRCFMQIPLIKGFLCDVIENIHQISTYIVFSPNSHLTFSGLNLKLLKENLKADVLESRLTFWADVLGN